MNASMPILTNTTIHKRPHYKLEGNQLFFLKSNRPMKSLSTQELAIWKALDENPFTNVLRSRFGSQVDKTIAEFCETGLCDSVSEPPQGRRRVLVFEPHSDDAVLSVGGTMWLRRNEIEFILVTFASRSNFTSYWFLERDFFDVEQITALRNAEATTFMRLLGGKHIALGYQDAPLRYNDANWSLDYFRKHRVAVATFDNHRSTDTELDIWKQAVKKVLRDNDADEIWMPLGIGTHTDHELTRNACFSALFEATDLTKNCTIKLFQDVPYDSNFRTHTTTVINELKRLGAVLVPEPQPIENVFDQKLNLLSIYASQFKVAAMQKEVEASSRLDTGTFEMVEHFWRLEKYPTTLDPLALYIDKAVVEQTATKLLKWDWQSRTVKRIRLLMILPAGRWVEDIEFLMRIFPDTHFEVYVSPAVAAEVTQFYSSRVHVYHVTSSKGWLPLVMRLALSRPAPTAFIAGEKRMREANLLAKLWLLSDSVVVPTMDHFVLALRQALAATSKRKLN
jgi:LmbE family N-acetylglucosaminyl deacetylase